MCSPLQTDRDEREIFLLNSQNGLNQRTFNFTKDEMANLNHTPIKDHIWNRIMNTKLAKFSLAQITQVILSYEV